MKAVLCLVFLMMIVYETGNAGGEASEQSELVIVQQGATSIQQISFMGMYTDMDVDFRRNDDCTPGWVAQQIEAKNDTADLFVIRTNMIGYEDLMRKGYCAGLNEIEPIFSRLSEMDPGITGAISYEGTFYAVPDFAIWDSASCLLCNPEHPLWSAYNLQEHHSLSDILGMLKDLESNRELEEWWLWDDHYDAGHLYNLCVVGSVNYQEAAGKGMDLQGEAYQELYADFDRIRQSLLKRTDPPTGGPTLFYSASFLTEYLYSEEHLVPVLVAPFDGQEEFLRMTLQVLVLNPYAPHLNEAIEYLNYVMDSYSPFQLLSLYPDRAEPIRDPYEEATGRHWILSPDLISWVQARRETVRIPLTGLMSLFWDHQGLEAESRYLEGHMSMAQYMDYLADKLVMFYAESR